MTKSTESLRSNLLELCNRCSFHQASSAHDAASDHDNDDVNVVAEMNAPTAVSASLAESVMSEINSSQDYLTSDSHSSSISASILTRNPHTVLTLDPTQISSMLNLSMEEVQALRTNFAEVIANDRVVGHSNLFPDGRNQRRGEDKELSENSKCGSGLMVLGSSEPSFISGANTALEAYHNQHYAQHRESMTHLDQRRGPNTCLHPISTGSQALDKLFCHPSSLSLQSRKRPRLHNPNESNFGIQFSKISQISGSSPTGKTQIALSLASRAILHGHKVHYLASGGSSASILALVRRLRHICSIMVQNNAGSGIGMGMVVQEENRDEILQRIEFDFVSDGFRLLASLHHIEHELLTSDIDELSEPPGGIVIIIDSISGCLAPLLFGEGDGGVGAALVNEIHLTLRRLSRLSIPFGESVSDCGGERRVAVFITNGTVSDGSKRINGGSTHDHASVSTAVMGGQRKPALGEMWRAADIHLVLDVVGFHSEETIEEGGVGRMPRPVQPGLKREEKMIVRAMLKKDSRGKCEKDDIVKFGIDVSGTVDI